MKHAVICLLSVKINQHCSKMKTHKIIIVLFLFALLGCESREEKIERNWKFMEGFHFGDFLSFEHQNLKVKNDIIYKNSKPLAVIIELKTDYRPGTENKLILKDIQTGKLGTYTDKGK